MVPESSSTGLRCCMLSLCLCIMLTLHACCCTIFVYVFHFLREEYLSFVSLCYSVLFIPHENTKTSRPLALAGSTCQTERKKTKICTCQEGFFKFQGVFHYICTQLPPPHVRKVIFEGWNSMGGSEPVKTTQKSLDLLQYIPTTLHPI